MVCAREAHDSQEGRKGVHLPLARRVVRINGKKTYQTLLRLGEIGEAGKKRSARSHRRRAVGLHDEALVVAQGL